MRNTLIVIIALWLLLLLWRIVTVSYPVFLPYAIIAVTGLGVATAFIGTMQELSTLPEALLDRTETDHATSTD